MLSRRDIESGERFLIVGTRRDGSRLVLDGFPTRPEAIRQAELFRAHLEGCDAVEVEDSWARMDG
jgi:hypothetical protein